ncbi:hypothetical protein DMN91_007583 [Ooceraea biroi]|uniref:Uncharacterized protein n=1 Tax=Ooceraea biroi TaxID=2015173 RepID=A0A3L8DMC2_OOCBI|nr:hypothetical protein DMN91_007583 [Ooceraea biroi]
MNFRTRAKTGTSSSEVASGAESTISPAITTEAYSDLYRASTYPHILSRDSQRFTSSISLVKPDYRTMTGLPDLSMIITRQIASQFRDYWKFTSGETGRRIEYGEEGEDEDW